MHPPERVRRMQNKETKQNFGKTLIRKLIVYTASLAIVAGILGAIFFIQDKKAKEEAARIEAEEEATKEAAKAAMTEEEIQALFKEHKKETVEEVVASIEETAETIEEGTVAEEVPEATAQVPSAIDSPVDWEGLREVNTDVYAWITVPGTVIDYPILQHATDNTYYLYYNIDGSYGYPGCIYTENLNSKDFTDNNTVIYGHNMKDGTMFTDLLKTDIRKYLFIHRKQHMNIPFLQHTSMMTDICYIALILQMKTYMPPIWKIS